MPTTLVHPPQGQHVSRAGNVARAKVTLCQVLQAGVRQRGRFIALIRDPEDGCVLSEVVLWEPKPGEAVELTVEWDKTGDIDVV